MMDKAGAIRSFCCFICTRRLRVCKAVILLLILSGIIIKCRFDIDIYQPHINKITFPGLDWISRSLLNEKCGVNSGIESRVRSRSYSIKTSSTMSSKNETAVLSNMTQSAVIQTKVSIRHNKVRKLCPRVLPNIVGRFKVCINAPSFEELGKMFPSLNPGGRYKPPTCTSRSKVALIIPYRDREEHLRMFLHNMHPLLQKQMLDYGIYVVEESGDSTFNRAMLMNIGYIEALKQYDYDCFIFHDVDLIPEDDRIFYSCSEQPRHMSVAINKMDYRLPYNNLFGGVCALSKKHMETVNGFSNEFWGWGGEDDDMANRLKFHGLEISRYPAEIARYTMLEHNKDEPNPDRYQKLYDGQSRFKKDGLSNLKYQRLEIVFKKLYTRVLVKIKPIKN